MTAFDFAGDAMIGASYSGPTPENQTARSPDFHFGGIRRDVPWYAVRLRFRFVIKNIDLPTEVCIPPGISISDPPLGKMELRKWWGL